ncbi:hypothetical protein HNQ38_000470 [Desulfovibrio intestinalis]|uniref:Uncharacterized protein n=1 Tax=Desulfovibrio intestinalis TaxID=58621 RepID=A0A7W8C0U2_9BACT|nr:hypothetical protein [Desulfovibrio intestinalis]
MSALEQAGAMAVIDLRACWHIGANKKAGISLRFCRSTQVVFDLDTALCADAGNVANRFLRILTLRNCAD